MCREINRIDRNQGYHRKKIVNSRVDDLGVDCICGFRKNIADGVYRVVAEVYKKIYDMSEESSEFDVVLNGGGVDIIGVFDRRHHRAKIKDLKDFDELFICAVVVCAVIDILAVFKFESGVNESCASEHCRRGVEESLCISVFKAEVTVLEFYCCPIVACELESLNCACKFFFAELACESLGRCAEKTAEISENGIKPACERAYCLVCQNLCVDEFRLS